jgi:tetratricopeptide (TPR) repeat protein
VGLIVLSLAGGLALALYEARLARAAQARSERHFADVRRLANEYLFEVDAAIRFLPGSTQARELVVSKALQYLDTLTRESGGDPQLQRELASGYERIGDIQGGALLEGNLGQLSAARASYERAVAIRRQLVLRQPSDISDATALADGYLALGRAWQLLANYRAAAAAGDEAIQLADRRVQSRADPGARQQLARAITFAVYPYLQLGDRDRAQALADQAVSLWRSIVAAAPRDRDARYGLMRGLHDMGVLRSSLNQHEAAADNLGQSAALGEELLRENPQDQRLSRQLAQTLLTLSNVLVDAGHPREAVDRVQRGIALRKPEIDAAPNDTTSLVFLRNAHHMLGWAEQAVGDFDAAAKDYLEASALLRRVLLNEPANNLLRQALGVSCQQLAATYEAAAQLRGGDEKRRLLRDARSSYQEAADLFARVEAAGALEADNRDRPRVIRERLGALAAAAQQ